VCGKFAIVVILVVSVMPSFGTAEEIMALSSSNSVDDLINSGDLLFAEGRYNESIELYNRAIDLNKSSTTALIHKGDAFMNLDKYHEAIESYDDAIAILETEKNSIGNRSEDILINLYKVSQEYYILDNKYNQVQQKCNELRDPGFVISKIFSMGFLIYVQIPYGMLPKPFGQIIDRTERVWGVLDNAVIAEDIFSRTFYCLIWESSERQNDKEMMTNLEEDSLDLQTEYNGIQERYRINIEQLKEILNHKCEALSMLNRYEECNMTKETIAELDQTYECAYLQNQGFVFSVNKDYVNSIKYLDEAIRICPRDADAWFGKGFVLYRQGKVDEAINAYEEAIEIDPDNFMAWNNKGIALGGQRKYSESLECFETAIRINPESADVWYNKGIVLEKANRNSEASAAFAKAKEFAGL